MLPAASGPDDLVYFVVRRQVGSFTRRFIEKLAPRANCVGGLVNQLLDSHLVYQGVPATSITLPHLPSTNVQIWADGKALGAVTTSLSGVATLPNGASASNIVAGLGGAQVSLQGSSSPVAALTVGSQYNGFPCEVWADVGGNGNLKRVGPVVVSGGLVTLPNGATATTIVAFLGYMAPFESAKLAYSVPGGSPVNEKKQIKRLGLILYDTAAQGLQFGQRPDVLDNLPLVEQDETTAAGTVWPDYDEPMMTVPGEWDTDARLFLLAQAPNPCTVGGVVADLDVKARP